MFKISSFYFFRISLYSYWICDRGNPYRVFEFFRDEEFLIDGLIDDPFIGDDMRAHPFALDDLLLCVVLHGFFDDVYAVATDKVHSLADVVTMRKPAVIGLNEFFVTFAKVRT